MIEEGLFWGRKKESKEEVLLEGRERRERGKVGKGGVLRLTTTSTLQQHYEQHWNCCYLYEFTQMVFIYKAITNRFSSPTRLAPDVSIL